MGDRARPDSRADRQVRLRGRADPTARIPRDLRHSLREAAERGADLLPDRATELRDFILAYYRQAI